MTETQPQATRITSAFRMEYAISVAIQAPPERVWHLLTNAADFPRWNSTIKSITGTIAAGQKIALQAAIAPDRTFNLLVSEFATNQRMVWRDGTAPMFTGVRTFSLSPRAGGVEFHMAEVYSGIMLPMIAGSLPDFRPAFEQYARDLKREAEKGG